MRSIAVMGAGATGSLVGGLLAHSGESVTFIDIWPPQVDYLKTSELQITTSARECRVRVDIRHVYEVAGLHRNFDIIVSAVNGYDVDWAMTLVAPLLKPDGWVIPLHDGMVEERVAQVVGRERVIGLVIDRLGVNLPEPGKVVRYLKEHPTTFIVGELDGQESARLEDTARLLNKVAGTIKTRDIWGYHWSKLPRDCTRSPITTLAGVNVTEAGDNTLIRRASIGVIAEVVQVGLALGHQIKPETLMGIDAELWLGIEEPRTLAEVEKRFIAASSQITLPRGLTSMGQHLTKRRRTEIEYLNGYVVLKGRECGVPTPMNAAVTESIKALERGQLEPGIQNIANILAVSRTSTLGSAESMS